jgi:hypothetical protein
MEPKLLASTDTKGLRQFAISLSWALPLLLMGLLPWWFDYAWSYYPLLIPATLLPLALVKPSWLHPFYRLWMLVFGFLGKINTVILLALVFVLVITPLGIVVRNLGKLHYRRNSFHRQSLSHNSKYQSSNGKDTANQSSENAALTTSNWQAPTQLPQVHNLKEPF